LFSRENAIRNPRTGESKPYMNAAHMSVRIITSKEEFAKIKARFDETKDASGRSMTEVCKEYWQRKREGR
jgi:hypothetical protein